MKSKQEIIAMLMSILTELQGGSLAGDAREAQKIKLELLYDILDEDVPEEYWEDIENIIYE